MKGCVMRAEGSPQQHGIVEYLTCLLLLLLSHTCLTTIPVVRHKCDSASDTASACSYLQIYGARQSIV